MKLLESNTRIPRNDRISKVLLATEPDLSGLERSRTYLKAVANVCLNAAQAHDSREVAAALDTLRRMPLLIRNMEAL